MKRKTIIFIFWILLWQLAAMIVGSRLLLPSPVDTIRALFVLLTDSKFYLDALATIVRCIVAIVLSLVLGFILAVASYRSKFMRDILSLPVSLFKSIPIMAVAIYMILLLSPGNVPVLVCFVMGFPIVYTNLLSGLDNMDRALLEMAQVYNISNQRKLRLIYIPSLYPYFSSAMNLLAGMSWKALVTAEVLSIPEFSLGYELMNAKYYLNTDVLFAYVFAIIVISVSFEKLVKYVLKKTAAHSYDYSKVAKIGSDHSKATELSNDHAEVAKLRSSHQPDTADSAEIGLKSVSKSFGSKQVLKDFTLSLAPAKTTAIMGPSGSGKTTAARILSGLETADSGEVKRTERIAFLFQEDRLLPWLNVYDNLAIVLAEVDDARIHEILKTVGLDEESWKLPGELSGGMSYRVAMARAFIYDAPLLIADEPFRGLDEDTRAKAINRLWRPGTAGRTVLMITHSQEDAELADLIVNMRSN